MNMYEDKYLREKVSRIIARQKEGKIVIAMHKDDIAGRISVKNYPEQRIPMITPLGKPVSLPMILDSAHTCLPLFRERICHRRWQTTARWFWLKPFWMYKTGGSKSNATTQMSP